MDAGVSLEIRLRQEINSNSTVQGSLFEGVVLSPVTKDGMDLIPSGTIARGVVDHVRKVGIGLIRERASIGLRVVELQMPDGRRVPIVSKVTELENAREAVDKNGRIQGIRSTNTPGYRATGLLVSLASVEPIALLFSSAAFATILRFGEPEIRLPAGAEFRIQLTSAVDTGAPFDPGRLPVTGTIEEREQLLKLVKRLPYRTKTPSRADSDLTNLVFIGDVDALSKAFEAAGWYAPENVTAATRYRTLRAVAENQPYHEAPMSALLLNGEFPIFSRAKSLNSFARRHHVRVFNTQELWHGERVTTASSTQDAGIGFSMKEKGFVHLIDSWIDRERSKVFDDLVYTGCVASSEIVGRPWAPRNGRNATGDRLITDGGVMVIRLNSCDNPRRANEEVVPSPGSYRGNAFQRASRRFFLTARNDLIRGNVVYQGINLSVSGTKLMMRHPGREISHDADIEDVASDALPAATIPEYALGFVAPARRDGPSSSSKAPKQPKQTSPEADRWVAPHMELGFHAGRLRYGSQTAGAEGLVITRRFSNGLRQEATVLAGNTVSPGWQVGGTLTVNSHRWISHELGFQYQRGSFELNLSSNETATEASLKTNYSDQRVGLLTRQLSYNTLFQLRPREARWSPYAAVGPALQLMHLTDAPFERARGIFRLGLSNIGMIQAAYNFGHSPPLEGGGIFQAALQYGGGVKVRVNPRWTYRLDFRNTVSPHPDFLTKSLVMDPGTLEPGGPARVAAIQGLKRGTLSQRRFSSGFSFTF